MDWKEKTTHIDTQVHAHMTHTQQTDHTIAHTKMYMCAGFTAHIPLTQKHLYIRSQTHTDTAKSGSKFN